jgi:hypothetical protein
MPTAVKGLNVFHPSQAVPDTAASGPSDNLGDDESGAANMYEEREDNTGDMDENQPQTPSLAVPEIGADEELHTAWSRSPSPLPPSRSRSSDPFNDHKRRHSAISSDTTSTPSTIQKRTRRHGGEGSSAGALHGLTAGLNSFGDTFLEGIARAAPASSTLAPSPVRKTRAITRAQELEVDLDDGKLAALIRIFQSDVNAADAYMVINRPGLRKAWIEDTLPIM